LNENNMLDHRFSVAPMMDWTDRAEKAKQCQHLRVVVLNHAGPNAVPTNTEPPEGERFRAPPIVWRLLAITA